MKRFFALALALVLLLGLAACNTAPDKPASSAHEPLGGRTLEIAADMALGRIPECTLRLGATLEEIKAAYTLWVTKEQTQEAEEEDYGYATATDDGVIRAVIDRKADGGRYTAVALTFDEEQGDPETFYYIDNNKLEDGVCLIATFRDAYGLHLYDLLPDVKAKLGTPAVGEEVEVTDAEIVFSDVSASFARFKRLRYDDAASGNQVRFFFSQDDQLLAVSIARPATVK